MMDMQDALLKEARDDIRLLNSTIQRLSENVILLTEQVKQMSAANLDRRIETVERKVAEDRNQRKGVWWTVGGLGTIITLVVAMIEVFIHVVK